MRRDVTGGLVGVLTAIGFGAAMIPFRSEMSLATPALVLVVPVVLGVVLGGYVGGLVSVAAGFVVYDFVFLPPFYTLYVGNGVNWVALGVYAAVMLIVARVVSLAQVARSEAQRRAAEAQRLFELSELLVGERTVDDMLRTIVDATVKVFRVTSAAILLPEAGHLAVGAAAGEPIPEEDLRSIGSAERRPVAVGTGPGDSGRLRAVSLAAAGRPVGILALEGLPDSSIDRSLLQTFANHAALALERARLREAILRSELLEESDRVRRALLGAVSHDLRTPLATVKVASSTLLNPDSDLSDADTLELYGLIDHQTDRLTRLVTSLLDLTRYQAGALELHRSICSVAELVADAVDAMTPSLDDRAIEVDLPSTLPKVDTDPLLIGQVLVNLIDNADRHAPPGTPISIGARATAEDVRISVTDLGPGVPRSERAAIFESFVRFDSGGRAGLGLSIARTFVEALGGRIWVEEAPGGGALFVFTLPVSSSTRAGRTDGEGEGTGEGTPVGPGTSHR